LVKQAAFCPSCGSAINSVMKGSPVDPAGPKDISSNKDMAQNQPIAQESSFDSTMIIKPQGQVQAQTSHKPPTPKPEAKSTTISAQAGNNASAPTMTQVQVKPPPGNTSQVSPPTLAPVNNTPINSNGFSKQVKLLIIAIVIVVILLIIMIVALFLINQGHHGQAMHYLMSWYIPRM
ncbi:MAG: hypothetical protein ACJ8BW_21165, partial [Ktedonobacteraceae bacterium]